MDEKLFDELKSRNTRTFLPDEFRLRHDRRFVMQTWLRKHIRLAFHDATKNGPSEALSESLDWIELLLKAYDFGGLDSTTGEYWTQLQDFRSEEIYERSKL